MQQSEVRPGRRSDPSTRRNRRFQPQLFPLEGRVALSTFFVTSIGDDGGPGELRQVVNLANAAGGSPVVEFAIPGRGPVITLTHGSLTVGQKGTNVTLQPAPGYAAVATIRNAGLIVPAGASDSFVGVNVTLAPTADVTVGGGGALSPSYLTMTNCDLANSHDGLLIQTGGNVSLVGKNFLMYCTNGAEVNSGGSFTVGYGSSPDYIEDCNVGVLEHSGSTVHFGPNTVFANNGTNVVLQQ